MTWIKVRTALLAHPKVVTLALRLGVTKSNALGALVALWCCADEHADDGTLVGATKEAIDAIADLPGFADALESVGWLTLTDDGAQLPRYQEHNGKTAKDRAQAQKRVAKARARVTLPLRTSVTRGEERREEKNTKDIPPTPQRGERAPPPKAGEPERTREPNPWWDTTAEVFTLDPAPKIKSHRTRLGQLARDFKALCPDDPGEIARRAARWHRHFPGATCTPDAVLKHWGALGKEPDRVQAQADPALAAAEAYHRRRRAELAAEENAR